MKKKTVSPSLPDKDKVAFLRGFDLVIVCGLYKSGTSLVTQILENKLNYYNPAHMTNPLGKGVGRAGDLYSTRECNVLFRINELILQGDLDIQPERLILPYLDDWPLPMILKDPKMLFTLPHWVYGIKKRGLRMVVVFTHRSYDSLQLSWLKAPFTKELLKQNPQGLSLMLSQLLKQQKYIRDLQIPFVEFELEELKLLFRTD